jgi:hypothetical protein
MYGPGSVEPESTTMASTPLSMPRQKCSAGTP